MDNHDIVDMSSTRSIGPLHHDDAENHNTSVDPVANTDALGRASSTNAEITSIIDKEAKVPDTVVQSRLFKLPPELRNKIYRSSLVTNNMVVISKSSGIPEPGLLLVNKVIRAEAAGIFYHENQICCEVWDYDHATLQLLSQKRDPPLFNNSPRVVVYVRVCSEERNWKNLVAWLHAYQQGRSSGFYKSQNDKLHGAEEQLVVGLFKICKSSTVTHRTLKRLLRAMRPAFVALHGDWARD